jgi:XFP N-terminal domain
MKTKTLTPELLHRMDAYWRAANYLSVGQIYLYDNPLLKRPLALADVKHMLLGHWGTTPGQNFIYVHLNRVIKKYDLDMIYVSGPGHGGPAVVGNTYLEGTYSEIYPDISRDEAGLRKLFLQFSFPGGIPSHASPECPGSIHEGGELAVGVVRQVGIDLQADISIFAVRPVVERPELVGGTLYVALAEGFVDCINAFSLTRHGANVLVVIVAVRDRFLEDGWIRGHPPQSILLDQTPEPAAGDQIPPYVVQPDGLPQHSQLFQRVAAHDSASPPSSLATFARRRRCRMAPLNRAWRNILTNSQASVFETTRPPRQITFMSSSSTPWCAEKLS